MRENFGKNFCIFNFIRIFAPARMSTIEPWCNGNTADFGSVILSSSLGGSTVEEIPQRISSIFLFLRKYFLSLSKRIW